jgi:hypothetical protein
LRRRCGRESRATRHFREALLAEALDALLSGDVDAGKTMLRDYVVASGRNGRV